LIINFFRINIAHNHDNFVNILFIQVKKGETSGVITGMCIYVNKDIKI